MTISLISETGKDTSQCSYGYPRSNTCSCLSGQIPNRDGCHAAIFAGVTPERMFKEVVAGPRPLDRPEPGCEAF